jgi:hypothetical protein
LNGSFASGVIASPLREKALDGSTTERFKELQYTAPVSQGNSGGPILNAKGEVMGIVTWGYTVGNSLNFATHISELDAIDRTYTRSVADFFEDTEYYKVKLLEDLSEEAEANDTQAKANAIACGNSVKGSSKNGEVDYYKLVLNEECHFSIAFVVREETLFAPALIGGSGAVELEWTGYTDEELIVCCATVRLSAGTYYIGVNAKDAEEPVQYVLYTYWDAWSDYEGFGYEITDEDMIS